jgi:uncharacterized protein (TIGR02001 family)
MAGTRLRILILSAAAGAALPAHAATEAFELGVGSDYVFRGVSRTGGKARLFGEGDVVAGPFYAGTWLTGVDLGDATDAEWGGRAGFRQAMGAVLLDLGVVGFGYPGAPRGAGYDGWEVKAAGSVAVGSGAVGAAASYAPNTFGPLGATAYVEANGSYLVGERVWISGALGRQAVAGRGDYSTWNVGATLAVGRRLTLDVRYHDADRDDPSQGGAARGVVTLRARLP